MSAKSIDPAGQRVDLAGDVHLDAIAVTVQPCALVAFGHEREAMGRLEGELLEDLRRRGARSGLIGLGAEVVDSIGAHTPVASPQAITCS